MAGMQAVAPGRVHTLMPARAHSRLRRKPGSEMPGVPASLTRATVSPDAILSQTLAAL